MGRKEIVQVSVDSFSLQLKWVDGEWEKWEELQSSDELADIQSKAQARLDKAKGYMANKKGMGKGEGPQ